MENKQITRLLTIFTGILFSSCLSIDSAIAANNEVFDEPITDAFTPLECPNDTFTSIIGMAGNRKDSRNDAIEKILLYLGETEVYVSSFGIVNQIFNEFEEFSEIRERGETSRVSNSFGRSILPPFERIIEWRTKHAYFCQIVIKKEEIERVQELLRAREHFKEAIDRDGTSKIRVESNRPVPELNQVFKAYGLTTISKPDRERLVCKIEFDEKNLTYAARLTVNICFTDTEGKVLASKTIISPNFSRNQSHQLFDPVMVELIRYMEEIIPLLINH